MDATTTELYTIENGTKSLTEYLIASVNKHRYEVKDENDVIYEGESYQHAKSVYEQLCREVIRREVSKPVKTNATGYEGYELRFKDEGLVNLTNAWKAARAPEGKQPKQWLELSKTMQLIETVAKKLNLGISDILITERGRYGGTFAHWQIFLAYAKYLGPEFHAWANQVVEERFGGENGRS